MRPVGKIVICEPDPEVRELLGLVVTRLGREASSELNGTGDIEALLVEPADATSVERAFAVRAACPNVPVVCLSIDPPTAGSRRFEPVAHVLKPFALPELERALHKALLRGALAAAPGS
jgi:hypothetical protein